MRHILLTILLMVSFLSISFASEITAPSQKKLPVETILLETANKKTIKFKVEIADDETERRYGLMGRESLGRFKGMLFVFETVSPQAFWMKDTLIPLDILFVDADGKITMIHENAKPEDITPLPSNMPVKAALEIMGGESARLGIKKGDFMHYKLFTK
jgi:uncharacterized membrane protein (UPF0127 family)